MKISISKSKELKPWAQTEFVTSDIASARSFANIITGNAWSPIVWANGKRKTEYFLECGLCVLDFDSGVTLDSAINYAKQLGLWFVIGTTKSHQVEKGGVVSDRFRLILRFSQTITDAKQYSQNMAAIIKVWNSDPQAKDGARWFAPCREIVAAGNGATIDVAPYVEQLRQINRYNYSWRVGKHLPNWIKETLTQGVAPGQRNCTIFRVCKSLQKIGFTSDEALALISKSNILNERELLTVVKSAYR